MPLPPPSPCKFMGPVDDRIVFGVNTREMRDVTLEECKQECLKERNCRAFEFKPETGECMHNAYSDVTLKLKPQKGEHYYRKDCYEGKLSVHVKASSKGK